MERQGKIWGDIARYDLEVEGLALAQEEDRLRVAALLREDRRLDGELVEPTVERAGVEQGRGHVSREERERREATRRRGSEERNPGLQRGLRTAPQSRCSPAPPAPAPRAKPT